MILITFLFCLNLVQQIEAIVGIFNYTQTH